MLIVVGQAYLKSLANSADQALEVLRDTWASIYNHMGVKNYNRVTISQVMEVKYLMGGYYWGGVGLPRVTEEGYYWRV